jgi:hypothetical protein
VTGLADAHLQFIGLQQNRQYDMCYREDIGHNPLFANSASTNHKGNAQFWLPKQIMGYSGVAGHNSVCN